MSHDGTTGLTVDDEYSIDGGIGHDEIPIGNGM
jgi:hypothetical protein